MKKVIKSVNKMTDQDKNPIILTHHNIDKECPNFIPITKSRELDIRENKKMYY